MFLPDKSYRQRYGQAGWGGIFHTGGLHGSYTQIQQTYVEGRRLGLGFQAPTSYGGIAGNSGGGASPGCGPAGAGTAGDVLGFSSAPTSEEELARVGRRSVESVSLFFGGAGTGGANGGAGSSLVGGQNWGGDNESARCRTQKCDGSVTEGPLIPKVHPSKGPPPLPGNGMSPCDLNSNMGVPCLPESDKNTRAKLGCLPCDLNRILSNIFSAFGAFR